MAYMRVLRKCAGDQTTDAELRAELQVRGIPTLLRRERLPYVARAARAGSPQNAGGKATPWMAHSFGDVATAVSTVQICTICETTFASEAALRTHMYRAHGNRGLARRFVADTQCPVCKKCFVTRARAVQHGDNTRCKHAMMSGVRFSLRP